MRVAMCGRITNHKDLDTNARSFDASVEPSLVWKPSYNLAPTQDLLVVGARDGRRVLRTLRWGLIPAWSKDREMDARCVQARAETVAERPAFREAFRRRRCLVLVTGWYEWRAEAGARVPWWFHGARGQVLALAGLWERWIDTVTGEDVRTCAVLTCAPNAMAARVHDRMPVVLGANGAARWLDAGSDPDGLHGLLRACPDDVLEAWAVDRRVGNHRHDDARLIERAA